MDLIKKSTTNNAMKSFETMCSGLLDKTITNKQSVDTLTVEARNKIKAVLLEDGMYSWGVLNSSYNLIEPKNEIIKEIFAQITKDIPESGTIQGDKLFKKYMEAPYSLNIYSLTMLACYVLGSNHEQGILMVYNNNVPVSIEAVKSTLFTKKNGLTQILNYSYGFMEKDAVERMQSLIVQIKANKYVEKCQDLLERLNKLSIEQVMPSELSEEVEYCRGLLNNGLVLKQQIYKALDMHKANVARIIIFADTAKDYEAAISIIEKFPKHENIQGNVSFLYSPEFLQEYKKLRIEVMDVLKNNIEQYINALSPNGDIRRVDYIKSRIAIISNRLNKLGLLETQEAAAQIGKKIIQDIEAKHKYQSIIDDIEYDIRKWKQELTEGWQVLNNNLHLMQEKKLYIEENVQDNNVTIKYSTELDNIIQQYKTKIQDIEGDIESNIVYITEATSLEEVESILSTITRRGNAFVPDAYKNKVEAIKQCFNQAREQIKNTVAECTITSLKDDINGLQLKINEFPTQVVIYELESILQDRVDRQNRWMTENVHALSEIDTFDVKRCIDYINRLQNYPRYITSDQEVKIEEKIALLNNRIEQCRVEGVINLFLQLSDTEKQQCIKQLNEMM